MVKGKFTYVERPTNTTRRRKKNNGLLQMDRCSNPEAAIPQSPEKVKQHKPLESQEPIPSLPTIRPQLSTGLTSRNKSNANEKLKSTTFSEDRLSGTTLRGSSTLATGGSASVGISCAPTKAYPVNTPDSDEQIQDHGIDNKGNGKSLRSSLESLSQEGKGEVQLKKSTPLDLQQMYGASVKSPKRTRKDRKLASNKQRNNVVPVGALTINIATLMDNNSLPSGSSAGSRSNTDAEHSGTGVQTPQKSSSSSEGELHTRSSSQQQSARHLLSTTPSIYNALSANPQSSIPRDNQPASERQPFSKTLRANEYTTRRFIQIKRAERDSKADEAERWRNHPGVIMATWGSVVGLIMTTTWGKQGRDKKLAHAKTRSSSAASSRSLRTVESWTTMAWAWCGMALVGFSRTAPSSTAVPSGSST